MNVVISPFHLDGNVLQREQERRRSLVSEEEERGPWGERGREDPRTRSTLSVTRIHVVEEGAEASKEGLRRRIEWDFTD